MADPFEVLRVPPLPMDPTPEFAGRLRARLVRAFDLPKGVTVSALHVDEFSRPAPGLPRPEGHVLPYLAVVGARAAIDWYQEAFGARLLGSPVVMPDGRIGHAELEIAGGGRIMLSEEHPEIGVVAPVAGGGVPVTVYATVPDVDAMVSAAVASGASLERAVADYDYGRNGVIRDPFGHRWLIATEPPAVGAGRLRHGDAGYASLWVRDADRASRFFSEVLGWDASPRDHDYQVEGLTLHHGINPGHPEPTLFLCYAVGEIGAALEAVRAAGGTAEEPSAEPWGRTAMCRDNQGLAFAVFEPPEGVAAGGSTPPGPGSRPGDLVYITMYVADSGSARDFYRAVLGWGWQPGRAEDGWAADDPVPMTGMSGGHDRSLIVPMYRVEDIGAAVEQVRGLGGRATDPEQQPYGITAECEDGQGTRFYLGQL